MSAFAMFSLKDPSLLAFDQRRRADDNLKRVYGLEQVPCDAQMRTTLDEVEPRAVKPLFNEVFGELQQDKVLDKYVFLGEKLSPSLLYPVMPGWRVSGRRQGTCCFLRAFRKLRGAKFQLFGALSTALCLQRQMKARPAPCAGRESASGGNCCCSATCWVSGLWEFVWWTYRTPELVRVLCATPPTSWGVQYSDHAKSQRAWVSFSDSTKVPLSLPPRILPSVTKRVNS
jgi:hypothetical protein